MTRKNLLSFSTMVLLGVALTACGNATSADAQTRDVAAVSQMQAGNWDIVPEGSFIRFTALQEGNSFTGEFKDFSGVIAFDPDNLDNSYVRIEIPLKGVDAGSNDRNSTLPGKAWFATKQNPIAIFETDDIVAVEEGYQANGNLTLKGTTLPVELGFNVDIDGSTAIMTGNAELDRTRWDVGAAPWNTDEYVSKAVQIDVQLTANRL